MSERSKEHAWKACIRLTTYRGFESLSLRNEFKNVGNFSILTNYTRGYECIIASIGPFATIVCEPRQVRKEATVADDSCAEMWLVLAIMGLNRFG